MRNRGLRQAVRDRSVPRAGVGPLRWAGPAGMLAASLLAHAAGERSDRIQELNRGFLAHLRDGPAAQVQKTELIARTLETTYAGDNGDGFVPDSLALLSDEFRAGMAAFDAEDYVEAARRFKPLARDADPYVAANAAYFLARSCVERGLHEEAEVVLSGALGPDAAPQRYTPYAPHLWFLRGFAESANLRFDEATVSLKRLVEQFADAPESVLGGARQLLIELERRDVGTLGEVSKLMGYAAARLEVSDAKERVRARQDDAIALLDKLIKAAEEQEKSQCSAGSSQGRKRATRTPRAPAQQSKLPTGGAQESDLHEPPPVQPGEVWGKLPPAEREKILQSLRDRFPSRYRELVEQYYRSLADEKSR